MSIYEIKNNLKVEKDKNNKNIHFLQKFCFVTILNYEYI